MKWLGLFDQIFVGFSTKNHIKTKYRSLLKTTPVDMLLRVSLNQEILALDEATKHFIGKKQSTFNLYVQFKLILVNNYKTQVLQWFNQIFNFRIEWQVEDLNDDDLIIYSFWLLSINFIHKKVQNKCIKKLFQNKIK